MGLHSPPRQVGGVTGAASDTANWLSIIAWKEESWEGRKGGYGGREKGYREGSQGMRDRCEGSQGFGKDKNLKKKGV